MLVRFFKKAINFLRAVTRTFLQKHSQCAFDAPNIPVHELLSIFFEKNIFIYELHLLRFVLLYRHSYQALSISLSAIPYKAFFPYKKPCRTTQVHIDSVTVRFSIPHMPSRIKHIETPCQTKYLKEIRFWLGRYLAYLQLPDGEINLILVAVDEICANAIIHANHECSEKRIELRLARHDEVIVVEVRDSGQLFDFRQYHDPAIMELRDTGRRGGLGLKLVNRIMDRVEFVQDMHQNVCRLYKRIPLRQGLAMCS